MRKLDGHGVFVDRERMAILWGEKRSEKTRVERPDSLLNFDMAIYSGDHTRERRGMGEWETKDASLLLLLLQAIAKKQQRSRGRR